MKYSCEIEIHVSRARFIALFDDPANLKQWMPQLKSFETIAGTQGQEGAQARLTFQNGMSMVETVTLRRLPGEFNGRYDGKGFSMAQRNLFSEPEPGKTRWVNEVDFQASGIMKLMMWVMPGAFKKESMKHLTLFKKFAEGVRS